MPHKSSYESATRAQGKAHAKVEKVMHEFKSGSLKSSSGAKVTIRRQAVAVALSAAGLSKRDRGSNNPARLRPDYSPIDEAAKQRPHTPVVVPYRTSLAASRIEQARQQGGGIQPGAHPKFDLPTPAEKLVEGIKKVSAAVQRRFRRAKP